VKKVLPLKKKASFNPSIKPYIKVKEMDPDTRAKFVKDHPEYGEIICNCEQVSLGEIEDVLSRSLPCLTIKAVKKRTRAGFGKCQGGFCQPKVLMLLAEHYGISPLEILYDKEGSNILLKESK
jgi:glycerol-3-phosphate dehydrogenase